MRTQASQTNKNSFCFLIEKYFFYGKKTQKAVSDIAFNISRIKIQFRYFY